MASTTLAVQPRLPMPQGTSMSPQHWRVLTDAIWPGAKTGEAIMLALDYCAARKLDPFKRPVHIVPMYNSVLKREVETCWPGINELQTTAARTGQWAGMDEPRWGPTKKREFVGSVWVDKQQQAVRYTVEYPEWCAVTVYRLIGGQKFAFTEPVYWEEAYARVGRGEAPNEMWRKRVRGQLHKVAKAASLRAAFPEEMGNDYTAEEMEGKETEGGIVIEGKAEPHAAPEPPPRPVRTRRTFLDELRDDLDAAATAAAVDEILRNQTVLRARKEFTNGHAAELEAMIAAALARTRLDDMPPIENDPAFAEEPTSAPSADDYGEAEPEPAHA